MRRDQPLYRDTDNAKIGGVCSGLGHYFDVDTNLVRVVFVTLIIVGGGGLLAYLLLWAVLDAAPPEAYEDVLDLGAETTAAATAVDVGSSTPRRNQDPFAHFRDDGVQTEFADGDVADRG